MKEALTSIIDQLARTQRTREKRMEKTKNLKKVIVSFIILSLLISVIAPLFSNASITTTTDTASITIEGLEAGVTAYIYQLTTVTYNYTYDQPQVPAYVWVEGIRDWIAENYPDYIDTEDGEVTDEWNDEDIVADAATEFYSLLIASIKSGETDLSITDSKLVSGTATYPVTEDVAQNSVTFNNLEMGTYLILVENGYRVYTPVVVNLTPTYDEDTDEWVLEDVTADCKSTTPQITKTVTDDEKEVDNYSTADTITYTIVTDIPTYETGSLATDYIISDVLSGGLVLTGDINAFGVLGNKKTNLVEDEDYTIEIASDLKSFTLTFDYDKISEYEQISVVYTSTLSYDSTTTLGATTNKNVATLTYSNNPYDTTSTASQDTIEEIAVITYGIELTKVDEDDNSITLSGAEFEIYEGSELLYFVLSDGVYYRANSTDDGVVTTVVTDEDGMLYLYGLDEGTYTIHETHAPAGYFLAENTVDVTITDSDVDGSLDDEAEDDGVLEMTFTNDLSFTLPLTGGTGTIVFVVVGLVLVVAGLAIIVTKKVKASRN